MFETFLETCWYKQINTASFPLFSKTVLWTPCFVKAPTGQVAADAVRCSILCSCCFFPAGCYHICILRITYSEVGWIKYLQKKDYTLYNIEKYLIDDELIPWKFNDVSPLEPDAMMMSSLQSLLEWPCCPHDESTTSLCSQTNPEILGVSQMLHH